MSYIPKFRWDDVLFKPSLFPPTVHDHDDLYYRESEIDTFLDSKVDKTVLGAASGVATLDADGKIVTTQLPPLAITNTYVVTDEAGMLALAAQPGDIAVRTETRETFILQGNNPAVAGSWVLLSSPTEAPVQSVNGKVGAVSLSSTDTGSLAIINNLSDLTDVPAARTNLGLNGAATRNVGTASNEVAAGNDPRFTDTRTPTDGTVTTSKIVDLAITTGKLDANAVTTGKITDLNVTTEKLAENAVTTAKITNAAVTTEKVTDGAVTNGKLATNAVTEAKIADGAVTNAKVATGLDAVKIGDGSVSNAEFAYLDGVTGGIQGQLGEKLVKASNLADLTNVGDARTNLGLGTAATTNTGTGASNTILGNDARLTDTRTPTDNTVTTAKIVDLNVTTGKIADAAVTNGKLAADSVQTANILSGNVTNDKLAADSVTADKIAADSVDTAAIINLNVTTAKLADDAVTAAKLADNSVVEASIVDGSVTNGKVASGIDAVKIGGGTVSNAEFSFLDGVTGSVQGQLDTLLPKDGSEAMSGNLALGGNRITGLADPVGATDATNKGYVDALKQGIDIKDSVVAATFTNLDLGGAVEDDTIDGVVITAGERVLLAGQSNPVQNGIYVFDGSTLTRAEDANSDADVTTGMYTFVSEGTNAGTGFVLTTADPIVLGTTPLSFTAFSGAGQIVGGAGLTETGNVLSVNVDGSTLDIDTDTLRVKALGITAAQIADGTITAAKFAAGAVGAQAIDDASLTNAKFADDSVNARVLATDSVTADAILAGAVGNAELGADAVTAEKILNGTVGTDELANDSVTAAKLAADAVDTAAIVNGNVTTDKLAANAVTTGKIADGAVTDITVAPGIDAVKIAAGTVSNDDFNAVTGWVTEYPNDTIRERVFDIEMSVVNVDNARVDADTLLDGRITTEVTNRTNAVAAVTTSLGNETDARTAADTALGGRIDTEVTNRTNADTSALSLINDLEETRVHLNTANIADGYAGLNGDARIAKAQAAAWSVVTTTGSLALAANNDVVLVDATSNDVTITLPAAGAEGVVLPYNVKKIDASSHTVTVTSAGGTIDGAASVTLLTQYSSLTFVSSGTAWFLI